MAKKTPVVIDEEVQDVRTRYYQAIKDGHGKEEAARIAQGKAGPWDDAAREADAREALAELDAALDANADELATSTDTESPKATKRPDVQPERPVSSKVFRPDIPASPGDDLTRVHGIGSGTVKKLHEMGVTSFAQIARWSVAEAKQFDSRLSLRGRIIREEWVEQAKTLAAGD